jgi:hypothetical protein
MDALPNQSGDSKGTGQGPFSHSQMVMSNPPARPPELLLVFGNDPVAGSQRTDLAAATIGDIFLAQNAIIWGRGTHMKLAEDFQKLYNSLAAERGWTPVSDEARLNYVALFYVGDNIEIRADADRLDACFEADARLQAHYGHLMAPRIHFLGATNRAIHDAIRDRGALWRIARKSRRELDIRADIANAQRKPLTVEIDQPIYYLNRVSGTRFVTYATFCGLAQLPDPQLAAVLCEVAEYSAKYNNSQAREVAFFMADSLFGSASFKPWDFRALNSDSLRIAHQELCVQFKSRIAKTEFLADDLDSRVWRAQMYEGLTTRAGEEVVDEEQLLGLAPEFFWKVHWLPGGFITADGIFMPDPVIQAIKDKEDDAQRQSFASEVVSGLIYNHLRRLGQGLESINVGQLTEPLANPDPKQGRREGYVIVVKERGVLAPDIKTVQMLRWGTRQYLWEGKSRRAQRVDILQFNTDALEYMEFVKDRDNGFKQLGGRLVDFEFDTIHEHLRGFDFSTFYLERDYVRGIATHNLPGEHFLKREFALDFYRRYGKTIVVPDIVVGRVDENKRILIDTGIEVCLFNQDGSIADLVVVDVVGIFSDCQTELTSWGREYARPITRRLKFLENPVEAGQVYVDAVVQGFSELRNRILENRAAYWDYMFRDRPDDKEAFKWRWHMILERILRTEPTRLGESIQTHLPH